MDVDETNMFPNMERFGKSKSTPFSETKEESKMSKKPTTYLDRCKEVGRVGPKITKLEPSTAMGTVKIFDESSTSCDVEGVSKFCSIRANTAVFKGKYYYEARILTSGLM
jgi:Kip1 ubiquitination-promoting complex protein 1